MNALTLSRSSKVQLYILFSPFRSTFAFTIENILDWYTYTSSVPHLSWYMMYNMIRKYLPFLSLKMRKESECWCPKNCPTIMSEYRRTNSKYLRLYFSCNQCWPRCIGLFTRLLPLGNSFEDDLSYFPGGLWPKRITWKEENHYYIEI